MLYVGSSIGKVIQELENASEILFKWFSDNQMKATPGKCHFLSSLNSQKQPQEVFCKKSVLKNFAKFTGKHLCQSILLIKLQASELTKKQQNNVVLLFLLLTLKPATLLKKRLAQVFSCEFCEFSKNTFFYRTPPSDCFWTVKLV